MRLFISVFAVLATLTGISHAAGSQSVDELAAAIDAGKAPLVIDVRSEDEYLAGHVPGARLIPHDQVSDYLETLATFKDQTVVLYCRSGKRAGMASEILEANGFSQVQILDGSFQAWSAAGKPVAR